MDVYRAYELALTGRSGVPVPMDERAGRYPHRDQNTEIEGYDIDFACYEKLDVEARYLERGGTVLRLAMVYGEHGPQRREEPVLRRVRAGQATVPIGPGQLRWTRMYADDVSRAVVAAVDTPLPGEILNIGETRTPTVREWFQQILDATGSDARLVEVGAAEIPPDLVLTSDVPQDVLLSDGRARRLLGWEPGDPAELVPRSTRWHPAHPPTHG